MKLCVSYLRVLKEVATCDLYIKGFKAKSKVRLMYLKVKNKKQATKKVFRP